jgi:hypothetical protein
MVHEKLNSTDSQSNGEPNKGVISDFPGGKQIILPKEPQLPEGLFINMCYSF